MESLSFRLVFLLASLSSLIFFKLIQSATVVVDGVSEWKDPTVQVGDSIIFEHKYHYNLYIFQNRRAFNLCNFTQATLLTKPNSTSYTWNPSRVGFFYFSFNNGSSKPCQQGQKLAINVSISQSENSPKPPPMADPPLGSVVPPYPWPFRPRESTSPSPAPSAILPDTSPGGGGRRGIPFITSNPAVPLPTGEADSATIGPLTISGNNRLKAVGFHQLQRALCFVFFLVLLW